MKRKSIWLGLFVTTLCLGSFAPARADISGVNPAEGTLGTEFTLTGSGFGEKRGKIQIGQERCQILSWRDTEITCRVVIPQLEGDYLVSVSPQGSKRGSELMTFASFAMRAPQITPGDPLRLVKPGELVTIVGAFFGDKEGEVYLRDTSGASAAAKVRDWRMESISFEVPDGLTGYLTLGVSNEVGLNIQPLWGTLTALPPGDSALVVNHDLASAHNDASGVYFNGDLWVFYSEPNTLLDKSNDIHVRQFKNGSFVSAPAGCGGTTDAQVVPLVIAHELWVFVTGENGGLYYKRYRTSLNQFETSWQRIGSVTTDHSREIAPVYNPILNRIEVYYWSNNTIYWALSTDRGANWSTGLPISGLTQVETAPSAIFYQQSANEGETLLAVGVGYADGVYPAVFSVKNGAIVKSRVLYPGPKLYGRPFLADLGEDYLAMTWVAANNAYPYLQKVNKNTGAWLPLNTAVAHPSAWPPNLVVNLEQSTNDTPLGYRWDAHLYVFWGREGSSSTTAVMSSVESLGFWQEVPDSPQITNLGSDMTNLFQLWSVIGVIDAPPFILNGQDLGANGTHVEFGTLEENTAKSEMGLTIGPYFETGEKSPVKIELSATVGEKIAQEQSVTVSFQYTLNASPEGNVGVYYLAPEIEVHKVQWNNPNPTTNFMYPMLITTNSSARFLAFNPTSFPRAGLAGMPPTYFDLDNFPLHQKANDWERLATYITPTGDYWFGDTLDWNAAGNPATLYWAKSASTNKTTSATLEFKIGANIAGYLGFGVEGSFEVQTETTTTITTESALVLDNPKPGPLTSEPIQHYSVQARWMAPSDSGFWVPLNRRGYGDQPWFITFGVPLNDIY